MQIFSFTGLLHSGEMRDVHVQEELNGRILFLAHKAGIK